MAQATRVVAIGVDLGPLTTKAGDKVERWDDLPPVSTNYREAREAILARLELLLRSSGGKGP